MLLLLLACTPTELKVGGMPEGAGPEEEENAGTENLVPIAKVSVVATVELGTEVTFDGSASADPTGKQLSSWAWSCTDGSSGDQPSLSLMATTAGLLECTLTVTASSGQSATATGSVQVEAAPEADWTFLFFVNGDNDLEEYALMDVNELEQVGSTEKVNFLVQLDRSTRYSRSDGDWTEARRLRVGKDEDRNAITSPVIENLGEVDSGSASTVVDFVRWGVQNYPAKHYALVIWDHGDGWYIAADDTPRKGVSWDEGSNREISVADGDLSELLAGAVEATGKPLDLFGVDACLMGLWEVAWVAAPYARTFVGSQDYESAYGWDYDKAFASLAADSALGAPDVGEAIASTFYASGDSTQSVTDLTELPALNAALDQLAGALMASESGVDIWGDSVYHSLSYDDVNVDLGQLLDGLSGSEDPAVAQAAMEARGAYDAVILSNYARRKGTGLSIYAPSRRLERSYAAAPWASGQWDELVSAMLE